MKDNIRILGVDDGPFLRGRDTFTCMTGVLMRMDGTIEKIMLSYIEIDGDNSTAAIIDFAKEAGVQNINLIITEGVTFAGFNVVDPAEIYGILKVPVISLTKGKGDLDRMIEAVRKHGKSGVEEKLRRLSPSRETLKNAEFTLNISGIELAEAKSLLLKLMKVGNVPEPVRIADMMSNTVMQSLKKLP